MYRLRLIILILIFITSFGFHSHPNLRRFFAFPLDRTRRANFQAQKRMAWRSHCATVDSTFLTLAHGRPQKMVVKWKFGWDFFVLFIHVSPRAKVERCGKPMGWPSLESVIDDLLVTANHIYDHLCFWSFIRLDQHQGPGLKCWMLVHKEQWLNGFV